MIDTQIIIGDKSNPYIVLDNDSIVSASMNKAVDPSGLELHIGTLEVVFRFEGVADLFCPSDYPDGMESNDGFPIYCLDSSISYITGIQYGVDVFVYSAGNLVDKLYVNKVVRTGRNEYTLYAHDWAGVLDGVLFPGLCFMDPDKVWTVGEAIQQIVLTDYQDIQPVRQKIYDSIVFTDPTISTEGILDGYIGPCTCREALQELMFGSNINLVSSQIDQVSVVRLSTNIAGTVDQNCCYIGGAVSYPTIVSEIDLEEYSYVNDPAAEFELIYDNTISGSTTDIEKVIPDGAPCYEWYTEGDINNVEFKNKTRFVLYGKGRLFGKRRRIERKSLTFKNDAADSGDSVHVDSSIITSQNSYSVYKKLEAYYFGSRRSIEQRFVFNGEICGRSYKLRDPFSEITSGILTSARHNISGIVKTSGVIEDGFVPYISGGYKHSVVLTGSGIWKLPAGVDSFRVTLVGGGSGGSSGTKGADGRSYKTVSILEPGYSTSKNSAGSIGEFGESGKIYSTIITDPLSSYKYECGSGGSGGDISYDEKIHNPGTSGSPTLFGDLTSELGTVVLGGVVDIFTSRIYGGNLAPDYVLQCDKSGDSGYAVYSYTAGNPSVYNAYSGEPTSYYLFSGGKRSLVVSNGGYTPPGLNPHPSGLLEVYDNFRFPSPENTYYGIACERSSGGGAAPGQSGGSGNVNIQPGGFNTEPVYIANGGNGGNAVIKGVYPLDVDPQYYGYGGGPGYGGGAGGNTGAGLNTSDYPVQYVVWGTPGIGGYGGEGGDGAPGCIIIYY